MGVCPVLIAEDDDDVRDNLALLLELKGFCVQKAANGHQALETINGSGAPCLLLLDLMMPVMNGWELREAMLKDPMLAQIPVVLLSGMADVSEAARSLQAVEHLRKPIDLQKLYRIVGTYCEKRADV
jgi:CheY-like chemotaxis protein